MASIRNTLLAALFTGFALPSAFAAAGATFVGEPGYVPHQMAANPIRQPAASSVSTLSADGWRFVGDAGWVYVGPTEPRRDTARVAPSDSRPNLGTSGHADGIYIGA